MFELEAADRYPPNVTKQDINTALSRSISDLRGLDFQIKVKEGAIVMLTANVDIADKLINDRMVTVLKIYVNKVTQKPSVIYIKFGDKKVRSTFIQARGTINDAVPIEPVLSKVGVHHFKPSSPEIQRIQQWKSLCCTEQSNFSSRTPCSWPNK